MPIGVAARDEQDGGGDAVACSILSAEDKALARPVVAPDLDTLRPVALKATFGHRDRADAHGAQPAGNTMRSAFMEGWWVAQMMR
jgi:hypothetical protein